MKELTNVPGLKPEDVVVIRKYSYGGKTRLLQKFTEGIGAEDLKKLSLAVKSGQVDEEEFGAKVDKYNLRIYPIVFGILKAPFFKPGMSESEKISIVEELDDDTGTFIHAEVVEYNKGDNLVEEKK